MGATFAGHYPWFATYNVLQVRARERTSLIDSEKSNMCARVDVKETLPQYQGTWQKLARNAGIGFCASVISDTVSNSIRVTKVAKQASAESITYLTAVRQVVAMDGLQGLFLRGARLLRVRAPCRSTLTPAHAPPFRPGAGLQTRILTNGLQGMMFSVVWKAVQDLYFSK
jgi:hypothetical protein